MTPFLQLLVAVAVAIAGAIIALRIDKTEHGISSQTQIDFTGHQHDDELQHRGAAMSRLR